MIVRLFDNLIDYVESDVGSVPTAVASPSYALVRTRFLFEGTAVRSSDLR